MSADATRSAESVAGLTQADFPCWYPWNADDGTHWEYGDGTPHWPSKHDGKKALAAILRDWGQRPHLAVLRESAPCWHLTCDECGYRFDEDEWVSHFPDRREAESAAQDFDWHIVEGRLLCPECVTSSDGGA